MDALTAQAVNRPSAIAAAVVVSGIAPVFFNVLPLIVGALVEGYGFNNQQVGALASFYMAGHTLATLTLVVLVRTFNWRVGVAAFAIVQALSFALVANMQTFAILGALLLVAGLGGGGLFAVSMTSLGDSSHPDRNFGLATFAQTALPAVVAFLLPLAVTPRWGVAGTLMTIALLAATCLVWQRWMPREGHSVG